MASSVDITIVVPLYNKAPYVRQALESICSQQWSGALEILVVDDGSTDGGAELVESLALPGLRLIRQRNAGVSAARNKGIREAQGRLVCFLDADDGYCQGFLAAILGLEHQYPEARWYATGFNNLWPDGRRQLSINAPATDTGSHSLVPDFYRRWTKGAFMCTISVALNREFVLDNNLFFPAGERLGEDQDVWFRAAEIGPLAYFNEGLADYRQAVPNSATAMVEIDQILPCYRRLAERLRDGVVPLQMRRGARRLLSSHFINIARILARSGRSAAARKIMLNRLARANFSYWLRSWPPVLLAGLRP